MLFTFIIFAAVCDISEEIDHLKLQLVELRWLGAWYYIVIRHMKPTISVASELCV